MLPSHHRSKMSFDGMEIGGGRRLVVVSLLGVISIFLCYLWMNATTANESLLSQVENLQAQLKITIAERDTNLLQKVNVEERLRNSEKEVASLHVRLQALNELPKQIKALEASLEICHGELDSLTKLDATKTATLEARRLDTDRLTSQLESKKKESLRLQSELDQTVKEFDQLKQTCKGNSIIQKDKSQSVPLVNLNKKENKEDGKPADILLNQYEETTMLDFIDDQTNPKDANLKL